MSVQRFNKTNTDQPFHIYYDMNVINNDSSFPAQPVRFQYKETRSNYFLLSPQDYFMSIVRFNLQTPSLPVFIPQINLNPNTNLGGVFPIQSMSTGAATAFDVNLFTPAVVPVGSVVYLSLSGGGSTSIYETSAVYNQYFRVSVSGLSSASVSQTRLTLNNSTATGTPANYAGGNVPVTSITSPAALNQIRGGTISLSYANFPIASMSFSTSTNILTVTFTSIAAMTNLQNVFNVGDAIFINNARQYNGRYTISAFSGGGLVFTCSAPDLALIPSLAPYVSGGFFVSAGDFYNVTPYQITLDYRTGGVTYSSTSQVIYVPNDLTTTPPLWNPATPQALTLSDITSPYYYVYNYEVFINMVNQAYINAFWGLNGHQYQSAGTYLPMSGLNATPSLSNPLAYQPPSMSWNQTSLTGIITADNKAFGQAVGTFIFMYFNNPLSTLFSSFPYQFPNVGPDSTRYSYVVFNTNAGAGLYVVSSFSTAGAITAQYTAIQVYQDHQTASLMNPIQSIVFTSTILPVIMENVGAPLILNGTSSNQISIGSTANVFPVVTDFIVPFSATSGYVPDISYVPSGEYRLVDLYGESPANQVDIQIYWKDQYGLIHPFLLGSGCSGSIKIMFRRKDYADVTLED
jgi:hypothetical protein